MWLPTLMCFFVALGITQARSIVDNNVYNHYRLPATVKPMSYRLQIITHLEDPNNLYFEGEVQILMKILEATSNITLHASELNIDETKIFLDNISESNDKNSQGNCIASVSINSYHNYYTMHLCEPISKGEPYLLTMPFAAKLNDVLKGYYKSSYLDKEKNETRWLSITQFEPAAARAAFPCFDEPELKAKFTVILGHQKHYTALSNMPSKAVWPITDMPGWVWTEFEESVPMSTYLVAYSVNDFLFTPSHTNLMNKVQFRTWSRPSAMEQCSYAADIGPKVLRYYEEIFDIRFPLDKIDQIAIPDFSAGAMENWGLVTYRETALLYAPNVSSLAAKQRVASVIAHELAHQWFGNLVTMKWWNDLWLNEGFATYVASLGVEHISPEWKSYDEESVDNTLAIFKLDALKSSHPILQPVHHANEINEIFDLISYRKGSAVLRMMHLFLGDKSFRLGIQNYLRKYAYKNAEQDNLWESLTVSAHELRTIPTDFDIKQIMDSWTVQTGYPIVSVTRDYINRQAMITQERYLVDVEALRSNEKSCWWVPLSYTNMRAANFTATAAKDWLRCDKTGEMIPKVMTGMPNEDEWIIFNIQLSGLYKVKYDERNWNMLIETLMSDNFERIHIINRAQLIDDALTLAWSGDQDYDIAMRLIEYLQREREYIPWKAALERLGDVKRVMSQTPEYEFFTKYMRKILRPIYMHLQGLNNTELLDETTNTHGILHKVLIASWSCRFEVEDCVPRAREYFGQWRRVPDPDTTNPVPSDLRSVIYCTAMRHGNDDDWQFLWARYKNSNVAAEKRTILGALGCTREIYVLIRLLDWAFDETSGIRKQDSSLAFNSVATGEIGFHLAKDYFLSNIQFLYNYYEPDVHEIARLLSPLANQMSSVRDYENLKSFVDENHKLLKQFEQSVRRSLETVKLNAQWKVRNYDAIARHLRARLIA